jgi:predicted DsbA family dithiol-disulfide isomerase
MKIEIWSDFTCPYCYLGKRNLEIAMEQFEPKECISIEYKSFELDPDADSNGNETKNTMLMKKYGLSSEKVTALTEQIAMRGKEIGLELQFEHAVHTNTFHAHRLVKYAAKKGKASFLIERLFETYFQQNENIGAREVLHSLAMEMDLEEAEADELLCLNKHAKTVRHDEQLAAELGITSVPFFIFNETHAISGAQPVDVFTDVLQELWLEEKSTSRKEYAGKNSCCIGNECLTE